MLLFKYRRADSPDYGIFGVRITILFANSLEYISKTVQTDIFIHQTGGIYRLEAKMHVIDMGNTIRFILLCTAVMYRIRIMRSISKNSSFMTLEKWIDSDAVFSDIYNKKYYCC